MKISKLLSFILGLSGFMRMGVVDGDGGGALGMHDAGSAFVALGDSSEGEEHEETEESAAERLAAEEADGATHQADDETGNEAEQTDSEKITIEVDGKKIELNKSDLPELYKSGLRQKDYTTKTMEVSEQRKTADAEIAKAKADRQAYETQLNNFAITTHSILQEQQKVLTQELLDSDPIEYLRQERTFNQRQAELGKAQAELQRLSGEHQEELKQQNVQFMEAQRDMLLAAVPDLKDEEKKKQFFGAVENYLGKAGFKAEDGRMVFDARVVLMADKAQKYDALMTRAKEAAGKVKAAPVKVERPGVAKIADMDGRTKAMKSLEKSGNLRDAAAIFANM